MTLCPRVCSLDGTKSACPHKHNLASQGHTTSGYAPPRLSTTHAFEAKESEVADKFSTNEPPLTSHALLRRWSCSLPRCLRGARRIWLPRVQPLPSYTPLATGHSLLSHKVCSSTRVLGLLLGGYYGPLGGRWEEHGRARWRTKLHPRAALQRGDAFPG